MQSFSRECFPAPDVVPYLSAQELLFGGVLFSHTGIIPAVSCVFCMRNLLGWLETRLAQITMNYLEIA